MKKHILVIDDDKDTLEIFKDILIGEGYVVTTFTEIDDILATIKICKPDLVILDYLLQGINGGEWCSQIKQNKGTKHLPVILTSAHSRVYFSLGTYDCDEFLEKPFDLNQFTKIIKSHLKRGLPQNRDKEYINVEQH